MDVFLPIYHQVSSNSCELTLRLLVSESVTRAEDSPESSHKGSDNLLFFLADNGSPTCRSAALRGLERFG
jgi:hypothetical protein